MQKNSEVRLTLPFGEGMEILGVTVTREFCRLLNVPTKKAKELSQAVLEAIINAIHHSKSKEEKVYLSIQHLGEYIKVIVHDRGQGFDPDLLNEPISENPLELKDRGWGLTLIKKMVDKVYVKSTNHGTHIILIKEL